MDLFERDPAEFVRRYIHGDKVDSDAMSLGREVHAYIENEKDTSRPEFDAIRALVPRYDRHEYEVKAMLDEVPLLGRLDGFNGKGRIEIADVKTGKKWTQAMAHRSDQLTFYALLVMLATGLVPDRLLIHWVETARDEDGTLRITGNVRTFVTSRTKTQIFAFAPRVAAAWRGIQELYTREVNAIL